MSGVRSGPWIGTYSGKKFYPLDPHPEDVTSLDIAHALSLKVRWTGHCNRFYSVGQHSLRVANVTRTLVQGMLTDTLVAYALLHDAAEAYLPDVARPLKSSLHGFHELEQIVQTAILTKYGLPEVSGDIGNQIGQVKRADNILLAMEAQELFDPPRGRDWEIPLGPVTESVTRAAEPFKDATVETVKLALLDRLLLLEARR